MSQQALKSAKTLFQAYSGALAAKPILASCFCRACRSRTAPPCSCIGDGKIGYYWPQNRRNVGINRYTIFVPAPAEAIRDLGMVRQGDIVLAFPIREIPKKSCGFACL